MRVFLAGAPRANDWRCSLTNDAPEKYASGDVWDVVRCRDFYYTGPFFGEGGTIIEFKSYVQACKGGILSSDLVYGWAGDCDVDADTLWALGYACGNSIRTAIGAATSGMVNVMRAFADQCLVAVSPGDGLNQILRGPAPDRFFQQPWRKIKAKFDTTRCELCKETMTIGDDIMWLKADPAQNRNAQVAHMDCFFQGVPARSLPVGLQKASIDVLRSKAESLEEENSRLIETIKDLSIE